jgi:hypothetical protein
MITNNRMKLAADVSNYSFADYKTMGRRRWTLQYPIHRRVSGSAFKPLYKDSFPDILFLPLIFSWFGNISTARMVVSNGLAGRALPAHLDPDLRNLSSAKGET